MVGGALMLTAICRAISRRNFQLGKKNTVLRSLFLIFPREEIIGPKGKSLSGFFYINWDTNLFMETVKAGFLNKRSSTQ